MRQKHVKLQEESGIDLEETQNSIRNPASPAPVEPAKKRCSTKTYLLFILIALIALSIAYLVGSSQLKLANNQSLVQKTNQTSKGNEADSSKDSGVSTSKDSENSSTKNNENLPAKGSENSPQSSTDSKDKPSTADSSKDSGVSTSKDSDNSPKSPIDSKDETSTAENTTTPSSSTWKFSIPHAPTTSNYIEEIGSVDSKGNFLLPIRLKSKVDLQYPDGLSLKQLCDSTPWKKDVYIDCGSIWLGLFNVWSMYLTCIRRALDAGISVIFPDLNVRVTDQYLWNYDRSTSHQFDYFFDKEYLIQVFKEECPQMKFKDHGFQGTKGFARSSGEPKRFIFGEYRTYFDNLLKQHGLLDSVGKEVIVVRDGWNFGSWSFVEDSNDIHVALTNAIRFNPNQIAIATILRQKLPTDYIGFHLRAEHDWTGRGTYENTVQWFIDRLNECPTVKPLIYVAVGVKELEERFTKQMSDLGYQVVSKWTLAAGDTNILNKMNALNFDQVGEIDFEILRASKYFFGVALSSFSYTLAQYRGNGNLADCNCHLYQTAGEFMHCCY